MKKFIILTGMFFFFLCMSLYSCSEKEVKSKPAVVLPAKEIPVVKDAPPEIVEPTPEKLIPKQRKDLDALLKTFLSTKDLENLIDDDNGVFYIENGRGKNAIYKQLYSKYDLLAEETYLIYFRDHELFPQNFYFPQQTDPCSLQQEGYYVLPVPEKNELLVSIYKSLSLQNNVKPKQDLLDKLAEIDQSVVRILMIHAKGKNDETVLLKFYLSQKGQSLILSAIDARPCSA